MLLLCRKALREEPADLLERQRRGAQLADGAEEDMHHALPDTQLRIHSGRQSSVDKMYRVIEQHFVVSDVDTNWREAGQVRMER